jgi:hypothetical protein
LNELNNQDNDGNHEQKMNQTAANVADKAQKPEHDQYYNYSPEHIEMFLSVRLNFRRPIYPTSHSLGKIFQHVGSRWSFLAWSFCDEGRLPHKGR